MNYKLSLAVVSQYGRQKFEYLIGNGRPEFTHKSNGRH
jgi:hypothetical protein